jgi:hypothetical protein
MIGAHLPLLPNPVNEGAESECCMGTELSTDWVRSTTPQGVRVPFLGGLLSFRRMHLTLTTNLTARCMSFKWPVLPQPYSHSSPHEVRDEGCRLRADPGKEGETNLVIEEVKLWQNLAGELSSETVAYCAPTLISAEVKQHGC